MKACSKEGKVHHDNGQKDRETNKENDLYKAEQQNQRPQNDGTWWNHTFLCLFNMRCFCASLLWSYHLVSGRVVYLHYRRCASYLMKTPSQPCNLYWDLVTCDRSWERNGPNHPHPLLSVIPKNKNVFIYSPHIPQIFPNLQKTGNPYPVCVVTRA